MIQSLGSQEDFPLPRTQTTEYEIQQYLREAGNSDFL